MNKREVINNLHILKDISPETKEQLLQVGKVLSVPKGTILIHARQPVSSIFIQLTGKSIIYNLTHSGKRKILFIFGHGNLLNEHVRNTRHSSTFAETIEASKILKISVSDFIRLMENDFCLTKNVLDVQEKKIWRLSHQLKNTMSSVYLERKLAAKLWKLARDFGVPVEEGIEIDVNMTITFLADMMGIPRETTSRVCSELIANGLIIINKKRIIINDPAKMARFYKTGLID